MFTEMLAGAMKASFYRRYARRKRLRNFRMTAPFLNQSQQGAILGAQLIQRVPQRV
ncbi:MAG: hypothetical protein RL077_1412 [Verrucomicrobiota bacterium]